MTCKFKGDETAARWALLPDAALTARGAAAWRPWGLEPYGMRQGCVHIEGRR